MGKMKVSNVLEILIVEQKGMKFVTRESLTTYALPMQNIWGIFNLSVFNVILSHLVHLSQTRLYKCIRKWLTIEQN